MEFTDEQIKMLAEAERKMDAGEVPFVKLGDHRIILSKECMEHFGLTPGQTITDVIHMAILRFEIKQLDQEIALRKNPH